MTRKKDLNFDCKQLRSFMEVLNEESFTRASRKLKIGQATISHHINILESMLGVTLLNRTSKNVSITEEGKVFRSFCNGFFKDLDKLIVSLGRAGSGIVTRVAASNIPSTYILPGIIAKLQQESSDLYYQVEISDSREVVEMVKEGRADIGVTGKEFKHVSLKYAPICRDEIVLIGSLDQPDSTSIKGLPNLPFIVREFGSGTRKVSEEALICNGISPSDLKVVMECSNTEGIKEFVASGVGVSFISKLALEKELRLNLLKIIHVKGLKIRREFLLVLQKRKQPQRPVNLLMKALGQLLE